jgi:uncharacterized protein (DUF433 family)
MSFFIVASMNRLENAEKLIAGMNAAEKGQLLLRILKDLGNVPSGIDVRPNVCGGEPCIIRTRIPVWLIVRARQLGTSDADILASYPTLRAEDVANAHAYYSCHEHEIEDQIIANEAD